MACTYTEYSINIENSLKKDKIVKGKKFIVFPIDDFELDYKAVMVTTTFGELKKQYKYVWNKSIVEEIKNGFPSQNFSFPASDEELFIQENSSLQAIIFETSESSMARIIGLDDPPLPTQFYDSEENEKMKNLLSDYSKKFSADYAVIFVDPFIKAYEVEKTYTDSRGMSYGSGLYEKKVYIRTEVQIWDCHKGTMLYSSGSLSSGIDDSIVGFSESKKLFEENSKGVVDLLKRIIEK